MAVDSLWHLRGSELASGAQSDEEIIERIGQLLEGQRKPVSFQGSDWIEFDSPLWEDLFGGNWLTLVIFDRGRIWVERGLDGRRLRYELRSLHGFIFCLAGAAMFFAVGAADGDVGQGLKFAGLAFGWLYGGNIALALMRVPHLFGRVVT